MARSCRRGPHLRFPRPRDSRHFNHRNARPSAMQTWRRTFATSVARLNDSLTVNARPATLRCAQILQSSKQNACSLEDQEIKVNGFIRSVRKQKRFAFAEISDGSSVEPLQAILKPAQAAEYAPIAPQAATFSWIWTNTIASPLACPPALQSRSRVFGRPVRLARSRLMSFKPPT